MSPTPFFQTPATWVLAGLLAAAGCNSKDKEDVPIARETVPVRVVRAGAEDATSQVRQYSGIVAEGTGVTVSFQVSGVVTALPIEQGQRVRKGQLLATIDGTTYREQYNAQLAQQRLAEDTYRRIKQVYEAGSIAETRLVEARQQYEQAKADARASYQNVANTRLYAPIAGYVSEKQIDRGAVASPGAAVATLVQLSEMKVNVAVPEAEINALHRGDPATVRVAALGNVPLAARIDDISPVADAEAHTFLVSVVLPNRQTQLKPSMTAQVSFDPVAGRPGAAVALVLPMRAVQVDERNRHFVYVVQQGRVARWREVRTGELVGAGLAVTGGLAAQEQVVVDGHHKLYDQARVQVTTNTDTQVAAK